MRGWENARALPEHILKMISPADRAEIGKGATLSEEAIAKYEAKAESDLQKQILALLEGHRGIVVIYSRMDRKATTPLGTPDFLFAVTGREPVEPGAESGRETTFACAWECKTATGKLDQEQEKFRDKMTAPPNNWTWRLIRSVEQALTELRAMGL